MPSVQSSDYNEKTIKIYLFYRLILGALFYLMFLFGIADEILGKSHESVFHYSVIAYLLVAFISFWLLPEESRISSSKRVIGILFSDLVLLSTIIMASGGLNSGLGYLLLITVATAAIFIPGILAFAFAAATFFTIVGQTLFLHYSSVSLVKELFSAGILGVFLFLTTASFVFLSRRLRASTQAAEEQKQYAQHLEQLAQHIIQRMRTGIVVIDDKNKIELINESALQLLDLNTEFEYFQKDLTEITNLKPQLDAWKQGTYQSRSSTQIHNIKPDHALRIGFGNLNTAQDNRTILFMEDYRSIVQHAQQLKLASLGRLTASIAHEIRNPLGSISHASQLLNESENLDAGDKRLIEIVLQNSKRIDQIIDNTSILSRRKAPEPEMINLTLWLSEFISEYCMGKSCEVSLNSEHNELFAKADTSNLRQVLTNLIENGLRYSKLHTGNAKVDVVAGRKPTDDSSYIDIIDFGKGVPEENRETIFEPFFTTDKQGSGLGLYISKELCQSNQAILSYRKDELDRSCFRISFPHYQRMI